MISRRLLILLSFLSVLGQGCTVYRFSEENPKPAKAVPRHLRGFRFRIARVENEESLPGERGKWGFQTLGAAVANRIDCNPFSGGETSIYVTADALDAEFARRHPDLHSPDGVPLFVHLDGTWHPLSRAGNSLPYLVGWRMSNSSSGRIAVFLYTGDGEKGRRVEKKMRSSWSFSWTPAALLPGPPADLGTHVGYTASDGSPDSVLGRATIRLVADAVAEAILALPEGTVVSGSDAVPLSAAEAATLRHLEGLVLSTSASTANGGVETTTHEFRTTIRTGFPTVPAVVGQRYNARTRKGSVRADFSECGEEAARRFALERLVPQICASKAVVNDFGAEFIPGATFRIDKESIEGSILEIEFVQIQ